MEKEKKTLFGHKTPAMMQLSEQLESSLHNSPLVPEEKLALIMKLCVLLLRENKTDAAEMKVSDGRILKLTLEKTSSVLH
ncbi:hypothetical protein FIN99_018585 [Yersinia pestis]|nr:hypothetical protein [Yersinia pestis]